MCSPVALHAVTAAALLLLAVAQCGADSIDSTHELPAEMAHSQHGFHPLYRKLPPLPRDLLDEVHKRARQLIAARNKDYVQMPIGKKSVLDQFGRWRKAALSADYMGMGFGKRGPNDYQGMAFG